GGIGSDKLKKIYIDRGNNSPH
ncbi:DNA-binding protein, partial [Bacillus paranthracis]|nr:DNA-binding protein [Bacillus paranthracis]